VGPDVKARHAAPARVLRAALAAGLLATQALVWAGNERLTAIRTNGNSAFANLVDPATQSSGFLNVARDAVAGSTALDFAWSTPVPGDPRHVVLVQGAGEIPNDAFALSRDGARLNVVTPFETVRCRVDIENGSFDCAPGPALAFALVWTRIGHDREWRQTVSEVRMGPLTVRSQGQFEQHPATVAGSFGGLPASGTLGNLIDTRGASVTREVRLRTAP
jgi:hypothetical protein